MLICSYTVKEDSRSYDGQYSFKISSNKKVNAFIKVGFFVVLGYDLGSQVQTKALLMGLGPAFLLLPFVAFAK